MQSESAGSISSETFLQIHSGIPGSVTSRYLETKNIVKTSYLRKTLSHAMFSLGRYHTCQYC